MADNDATSEDVGPFRGWLARSYADLTDGQRWTIALVIALVVVFAAGGLRQERPDEVPLLGSSSAATSSVGLIPEAGSSGSTPVTPPETILSGAPTPLADAPPTTATTEGAVSSAAVTGPTPSSPYEQPTTTTTATSSTTTTTTTTQPPVT